jgi:hypothetical protein
VATLSVIDLQIGDRLYPPMVSYDYSVRVAMIAAMSRHFPLFTPFLSFGHPWPLQYHYYWFVLCNMVYQLARGAVRARQALIAGTIWSGFGLLSIVLLYLRHWMPSPRMCLAPHFLGSQEWILFPVFWNTE